MMGEMVDVVTITPAIFTFPGTNFKLGEPGSPDQFCCQLCLIVKSNLYLVMVAWTAVECASHQATIACGDNAQLLHLFCFL